MKQVSKIAAHRVNFCRVSLRTHVSSSGTYPTCLRRARRKVCDASCNKNMTRDSGGSAAAVLFTVNHKGNKRRITHYG